MKRGIACLLAAGVLAGPVHAESVDGWQAAGRAGEVGLVAVALGKTIAEEDRQGAQQFAFGMGTTVASTEVPTTAAAGADTGRVATATVAVVKPTPAVNRPSAGVSPCSAVTAS